MRARSVAMGVVVILAVMAGGCDRHAERNKECGEWAEWSNTQAMEFGSAVTEEDKRKANKDQLATNCKAFAKRARALAEKPVPFKDPYVKDLAERVLATYKEQASAFDACAKAWSDNDRDGVKKALQQELDIGEKRIKLSDEWLSSCRK